MLSVALIAVPLLLAIFSLFVRSPRTRALLIPVAGTIHLGLVITALLTPKVPAFEGWIELDRLGRVVLLQTGMVYFVASLYAPAYLALRAERNNRWFVAAMLAFVGIVSLNIQSTHVGLMWVALESLTLACGPLVYFNRNARSLEATWKYLLIGSVGIAIALLGSLFLGYSAFAVGLDSSLLFKDLIGHASQLSRPWLESAFVLLFVGYGTKMGLAPMHTWKPDAYGEAPGLAGMLLAGCVTSCAFLGILRFYTIMTAAGELAFVREIMIVMGLLSMIVAAAFLVRQRDYKRMLAYSSVEHMGILVLGIGIGGSAIFGALLHLMGNGLAKGVMFLSAGNIHRAFGSKQTSDVHGAIRALPITSAMFLAGFFALTGSPPFVLFLSELTILREAIASGQWVVALIFLLALIVIFMGMGATVLNVVQGAAPEKPPLFKDRFATVAPIAILLGVVLMLGVYIPPPLESLLRGAALYLEARP
jgi:hydrogenase-4 component F